MAGLVKEKSMKDAPDHMRDVITDVPDQTNLQKKEDDTSTRSGKYIRRLGFGNIFKDGPIKLRKSGNLEKLVPDCMKIDENNKDETFAHDSTTIVFIRTADNVKDVVTDGSVEKPKDEIVKRDINDKPLITGRSSIGDVQSVIVESGPNNLPKPGTSAKLMSDDTPTENEVMDENKKDDTLVHDSTTIVCIRTADNVIDVTDRSVEKPEDEIVKKDIKDKPLITGRSSIGDTESENVESGPNKLPKTGISPKPMSDDKPTENEGQITSSEDSYLNSECEVELGSDFIEECFDQGQVELRDEAELGSDFIEECLNVVMSTA